MGLAGCTHLPSVPFVTKWYQAKVAAQAGFDRMVITSPNCSWIPEYPREVSVIETFDDGRWGMHEYSIYPQDLCRGWWHLACIPLADARCVCTAYHDPITSNMWEPDTSIGFNGLGYISKGLVEQLTGSAKRTIRACEKMKVPAEVRQYIRFLITILRVFLDRMCHIPAVPSVAIAVAAHVQRLCLELEGLKTYMEQVVPRLESDKDYSQKPLDVLGAFVREGTDAATLTRVGIPVFYLRPLTHNLPVWEVVTASTLQYLGRQKPSNPPILLHPKRLAGVANLTGSWQRNMVLAVSGHLGRNLLGTMSLAEVPAAGDVRKPPEEPAQPPEKRVRLGEEHAEGGHLGIRVSELPSSLPKKKKTHRGKRRSKGNTVAPTTPGASSVHAPPAEGSGVSSSSHLPPQPAKAVVSSPFYVVPSVWAAALRTVSPLPQTSGAALYFFPPPFLLDTLPLDPPPDLVPDSRKTFGRVDDKVTRYVHNFARIRAFCRARILDPHLSNEPLTISDWRAALWGDYREKTNPLVKHGSAADHRRAQRRRNGFNEIGRLLSRGASIPPYDAMMVVSYDGEDVDVAVARTSRTLRCRMLWECHEINFRAESTLR